ncbi:MAG: hypothetical protein ABIR62_04145 [Dokdonella sp.]|uniref:hypothetical protein n=1 Tax=Dokdonella sp. TaxID=2291710 RepID=UPI00326633EB
MTRTSREVLRWLLVSSALLGTVAMAPVRAARMALSESDVTFEVPAGAWKAASVSAEKPLASLWLCAEGEPSDPCTVRAELLVGEMIDAQQPSSLDALSEQWRSGTDVVTIVSPRRIDLGGRDALEHVSEGQHSDHVHKQVYFDMIVLKDRDTYYTCMVTMDPPDFFALGSVARDACASLHTASPHSG